jgi:signal transduction histidine kinase
MPIRLAETNSRLPLLQADAVRLRQALDNLIQNAAVHSPAAVITVRRRTETGSLLISVSDDGPGIDPAEQERIFEPGSRLDRVRPGSGLGLAVVRAVAEAHGGRVDVVSTVGEGATFTIVLPIAAD